MIPEYLLAKIEKSDVIYRCIGNEMKNGILACGFMRKETADRSQYHFSNEYYSCFVLLRGSGEYIAEDGTSYPLQAGSLVQRLPGVPHSTRVDPDGKWLEFFISIGKPFFDSFCSLSVLNREPVLKAELLPGDLERYQKLLQSLKATPDSLLPLRIPEMEKEILRMYGYHAHRVNLQRDPIEAPAICSRRILMKKFLSKNLPGHSRSVMRRFEKYLKNRPASLLHGTALGRKWSRPVFFSRAAYR